MGQGPVLVIPASGASFDGMSSRVAGTPIDSVLAEIRENQDKAAALATAVSVEGKRHLLLCIDYNGNTTCTFSLIRTIGGTSYYDKDYVDVALDASETPDGNEVRAIPVYGSDSVAVQFSSIAGAPLGEGSGINVVLRLI